MHSKAMIYILGVATFAMAWLWQDVFEEAGRQDRVAAETREALANAKAAPGE